MGNPYNETDENVNLSSNRKDKSNNNIINNSFNKEKQKMVANSYNKMSTNNKLRDTTNLDKRFSEDVDERPNLQYMKPKYRKTKTKKILKKNTNPSLNNQKPIIENITEITNVPTNPISNPNIAEEDILEEQLAWINELAREKYGSSEQLDEILQKQRKKYRLQLRDYMKHLKRNIQVEENLENRSKKARKMNIDNKIKSMQIFEKKIISDLENFEKSSQLKIRDKTAWYENHVTKMVYALRKQNDIIEKKKFKEESEKRVVKTKNI